MLILMQLATLQTCPPLVTAGNRSTAAQVLEALRDTAAASAYRDVQGADLHEDGMILDHGVGVAFYSLGSSHVYTHPAA
jgi:hypothetical protein